MRMSLSPVRAGIVLAFAILCASLCSAQFNANIQGIVLDPSGAGLAKAKVSLVNTSTQVTATTTSDSAGNYHFAGLLPGTYHVIAEAPNFARSEVDISLLTEQNLNVPITLKVGSASDAITVTAEAPIVDTADSRTELTLESHSVAQLPVVGRNLVTLVTLAPGVTGLGTGNTAGTPAYGIDNFSTEEAVDANANGQGSDNNQYIVDGLDVTSGIRQGVLNLTPTPDSIQETTIQVNTYSSQYSRGAGLQTVFTTRSGTDQFHGSAADYFTYQGMFANQHLVSSDISPYKPFHENDFSFAIGGPVIPHHQLFFYFAAEPKRSSTSAGGLFTAADPDFLTFTQTTPALAGTVGTHILNTYLPSGLTGRTATQTAQQVLGTGASGCDTAATDLIPCTLNMIDTGFLGATAVRNGTQYFARLDKEFKNDAIYASLYRTVLTSGLAVSTPDFATQNPTWEIAPQVTWQHTFSPTTLNIAAFGESRVEGELGTGAKDYSVPDINAGISQDGGLSYGVNFAQGDFIQHNYHWRDVLTHVHGAHTLKFGIEGWYGDDVENFEGPWSTPTINFNNILALAQDSPNFEGGVFFNPNSGTQQLASWDAADRTLGIFAEDTWKVRRNLTLTLGLRYDDSGNPYSKSPTTVFGNFYLGTGATQQDQIANGYAKATQNALLHRMDNLFSPRGGFSWDPTGNGEWVLRGGAGIYNNWLTSANLQEEFRGSPPGEVSPGFFPGSALPQENPVFLQGTQGNDKAPYGFQYPSFPGGLNAQGGVPGANFNIGGINPLLKSPKADVWSLSLERKLGANFAASAGYSGSHSYNIVDGGNNTGGVSYGADINVLPGDLITHESLTPTRLNQSFGTIFYSDNTRRANYEGVFFDLKGKFSRGYIDASYTHSSSKDDAGVYPTAINPNQYYGPSAWDVPNRFSLSFNYSLKGLNGGAGAIGHATGGWGISGTTIFQSGAPLTVGDTNTYIPTCATATACPSPGNPATGYAIDPTTGKPLGGDFNADGYNNDYPDAVAYTEHASNKAFLTGTAIPFSDFALPAFGSNGNEKTGQFRGPNYFDTDVNIYKDTRITERVNFQIRFEFFNLFNRTNLQNIDFNLPDGNFGAATSSHLPRFWQLGGKISF
jgi:hypothetical protein